MNEEAFPDNRFVSDEEKPFVDLYRIAVSYAAFYTPWNGRTRRKQITSSTVK